MVTEATPDSQPPDLPPARLFDPRTPPHVVTLVLASGIAALAMNVFLPSLPAIAADLGAEYAVVQLAVSAYLAATAVLQLCIGPLSDRYGRRRVMIGSMLVFLVATAGCALATSIEAFLGFRILQATVASGIALSRAAVRDMFPPEQAASKIGYVTMGMAVAPMLGPMLGGVLEAAFGWRASFVALGLIGALVLVAIWTDMGETNRTRSASFAEQFRAYPELFASRRFWGYAFTAAFASGAFFAFLGGGPWVATNVLGMSPAELGLYFGIIAGGYMSGNFLSGRFSVAVGINRMLLAGSLTASAGMALAIVLFWAGLAHPLAFFGPIFFVGLGNGMTMPNATSGTLSVRPQLAGSAAGLGGALMIGGGAALSAITGALLGPGTGAWPLLFMMFGSSFAAVLSTFYVMRVAMERGPLQARLSEG